MKKFCTIVVLLLLSTWGCTNPPDKTVPADTGTGADTSADSQTHTDTGSGNHADTGTGTDTDTDTGTDTDNRIDTGSETDTPEDSSTAAHTDTTDSDTALDQGVCTDMCNALTPANPIIGDTQSSGSVTTYGSPSDPEFSVGGACNYGQTQLQYYAAIHVHVSASNSDYLGPWQNGHACGGCMKVRTRTADGYMETIVRITDRCADEYCGIDLGGAPAADVMPLGPGRYEGEWEWISCEGHPELFDGPTSIRVKDGANPYWSIIQVRNPPSQVKAMFIRKDENGSDWTELLWAMDGENKFAENFYVVPSEILQDDALYIIRVDYTLSLSQTISLKGSDLSIADATYPVTN